ncbi:hypothetical protein MKEN_00869400 [Mycena kentingensis (nom. inval.)]|nr:hypothetical protein MKEN_00869400 [Mycena kentingensis (nom. inval.)]
MFNLAILRDAVAVHPSDFGASPQSAIISELNKKYANRVLHDIGLCICVFDLTEAGEGKVRYGDGFLCNLLNRHFSAIPSGSYPRKSHVFGLSLDFFDDIYVPVYYLPAPNAFDPNEPAHLWLASNPDINSSEVLDTPIDERMWIDKGEVVRIRVESDEFSDNEPGPVKMADGIQVVRDVPTRATFTIFASDGRDSARPRGGLLLRREVKRPKRTLPWRMVEGPRSNGLRLVSNFLYP